MPIHRRAVTRGRLEAEIDRSLKGRLAEAHAWRAFIDDAAGLKPGIDSDAAG